MTTVLASSAATAPIRRKFNVRPQSVADALIDFAVQADISIGGVSACKGQSGGLQGAFTIADAAARLTAGSCQFELIDGRTLRIRPPPKTTQPAGPVPVNREAQRPAPEESTAVAEVLVTSTKRLESVRTVPASISVLGHDGLDLAGVVDERSAIRQIAGVTMTNLGAGRDKILLRGLSDGAFTGRTRSTVGTFLDNAPITYNAPNPDLKLADIDALEVVRGPQGALYGSGSLSGVFRIVTRKPELDHSSGELSVGYGWTLSGSDSIDLQAMANLPLVQGTAALRGVVYHEVRGGYLDNLDLRLTNVDKTTRDGGRAALRVVLSDNWSLNLSAADQRLKTNDAQYVSSLKGATRTNRVRESHDNKFFETAAVLEGVENWGRIVSSSTFVRHKFDSHYDATAALSIFDDSVADFGVYTEGGALDIASQDLVFTSPNSGPLRWLIGGYAFAAFEQTPSALDSRVSGSKIPKRIYTERRKDRVVGASYYGKASWTFAPGWSGSVGGRVFNIGLRTRSEVTVLNPSQARDLFKTDAFRGVSPEISIQHAWTNGNFAYALLSEGFRPGGFNSGGLSKPSASKAAFRPDRLRNYEIGAKLRLFDRRLQINTAAFYDVWTDIQTDQYLSSGLSYTANVGDGRDIGLEVEAVWKPNENWTLMGNMLVADPKVTRIDPAFINRPQTSVTPKPGAGASQPQLPGVPDLSLGSLLSYRHPLNDGQTLRLSAELGYVGHSRLTFDPAYSPKMGGYATAALTAQLLFSDWRLSAHLENVANSKGDTFAYGNPFSFGQVRQATPQRPRTLSLEVSRVF